MEMKVKVLAVAISTMAIAGCGSDAIDKVKNAPNGYDSTYTNEQLLSNKNFCTNLEWSEFVDSNNRTIVEASCTLGNPKPQFTKFVDEGAAKLLKDIESSDRGEKRYLELAEKNAERYEAIKTKKDLAASGIPVYRLSNICGVDYMRLEGIDYGGKHATEEQKAANFTDEMNKCVANLNKQVAEKRERLDATQDVMRRRAAKLEAYKEALIKVLPTSGEVKVQWTLDANGKGVYISAASLSETTGDKVKTFPVQTNKLFQQATNPNDTPFGIRIALLSTSYRALQHDLNDMLWKASLVQK
ncbi:hypothetical protein [Photobacterium damselae]|uniref:hypothetical protein n=1 Tax=Photobacterium damselae TaxID=38293 RepID=UPI001F35F996|nr:hypothetical protein [Photobacterium damselae]UKA04814.1 hypothetical protein IHC89_21465 [Photobacterium damselae subsp. damselae]